MRLGIYIHIPFCKQRCSYCDFLSSTKLENEENYIKKLKQELVFRSNDFNDYEIDTIFVGGGTPSVLRSGALSSVMEVLSANYHLTQDVEVTVEANPDTFTEEKLQEYSSFATRVSLGVQSLSDKVLSVAGRLHDEGGARKALELLSNSKLKGSADLILGLPLDTLESVVYSVKGILDYGIDHLSAYGLKIEEGTPFYRDFTSQKRVFPDDDTVSDMYDKVVDIAKEYGLMRYEVSNFARIGSECKHNVGYWKRKPYLGVGIGAHSLIDNVRYENTSKIDKYLLTSDFDSIRKVESLLSDEDCLFEEIMLGLRLSEGICVEGLNKRYNIDFESRFSTAIKKLKAVLNINNGKISVKEQYFYALNSIIVEFFE